MKIVHFFYLLIPAFNLITELASAQKEVSVNMQTGTANVVIPISTLNRGAVQLSVNLLYSTNGVRVSDVESNAGMGWQVVTGGWIIRERRGLLQCRTKWTQLLEFPR